MANACAAFLEKMQYALTGGIFIISFKRMMLMSLCQSIKILCSIDIRAPSVMDKQVINYIVASAVLHTENILVKQCAGLSIAI